MPELSKRTESFTDSVIRRMTRIADEYNAINLSQGFPDFDPPREILERLKEVADEDFHQYSITWGSKNIRDAIAKKQSRLMNLDINPEKNVVVTCGSTEAMMAAVMSVADPGDKIIVFSPFYENYGADAILCQADPIYVLLNPPEFGFDVDVLEKAFRENNPKALILCNPSNPCGKVFTREELEQIADLAKKYDAFVITDEVYEHIVYPPNKHIYMASLPGMAERTISCSSLSKTYSITGWRLGYVIGPENVIDTVRKVHDFLTVGAAHPLQEAVVVGLNMPDEYYEQMQQLYLHKRNLFCDGLTSLGLKHTLPQGAYYVMVDISEFGYDDDQEFAEDLIKKVGVAGVPGSSIWAAPLAPARPRQKKKSQFDPYYDEIRNKFEQNATTIQAIFKYFQSKYGSNDVFRSYDSFKSYVKANKLNQARSSALARVRYETAPGEELQVDWKESLAMTLKNGEVIHFNLFTAVYGYSRYVKFIYSRTKTTEDFLRCVIETVESAGGLPKYIKTDNMSAIVKSVNGRARKLPQILQFEKDLGVPIRLCKVRNPQSKGKVESANRFVQWLEPYQNELSSEEELIQKIDELNRLVNKEPSRTTDQVRAVLMKKEKEHLRPINNRIILDSYFKDVDTQVVPNTLLVNWKGHGYSVPKEYVGKRVKLVESDDHLQVYYTSKLIAAHVLSEQPFNYAQEHYVDGLKDRLGKHDSEEEEDYEDRITRKARESLALMKNLKGNSK